MFGRKNPLPALVRESASDSCPDSDVWNAGILSALRKLTSCLVLGEGNEMDAIASVGISVLGIFSGVHVSAVLGLTYPCLRGTPGG